MMNSAKNTRKGRRCQVHPKPNRGSCSLGIGAPARVSGDNDLERRTFKQGSSWKYHPRPRDLSSCLELAATASAAAGAVSATPSGNLHRPGPGDDAGACIGGNADACAAHAEADSVPAIAAEIVPQFRLRSNNSTTDTLFLAQAGMSRSGSSGLARGAPAVSATPPCKLNHPDADDCGVDVGGKARAHAHAAADSAAAAAAAVVPPMRLRSNFSTDLLLLAAGVSSNGSSGLDFRTMRRRSLIDSTTDVSSPSIATGSFASEQAQQNQRHRLVQDSGNTTKYRITAAAEDGDGARALGHLGDCAHQDGECCSSGKGRSGCELREPEAAVAAPAAAEKKSGTRLTPRFRSLSPRWAWRRRSEEASPVPDNQGAPASLPLSPPSSPATEALPPTSERGSLRKMLRSPSNRQTRREVKPQRGVLGRRPLVATSLAWCAIFEPARVSALYDTRLSFDPAEAGYPTEITFTFTPTYGISEGKFIRLYLAGFTRGERDGAAGEDLGFGKKDEDEADAGNYALGWPSDTFRGWWSEGSPAEEFEDSIFNLYTAKALEADVSYTAIIDRSSSLKSNCGHPRDHSAFYAWVDDETTSYKMFGKIDWVIEQIDEIPMSCYLANTSLTSSLTWERRTTSAPRGTLDPEAEDSFDPPLPQTKTEITVAFQPARDLVEGDNVTVNLKGFTSGAANGTIGKDFELGELLLAGNDSWLAAWEEGSYVEGKPGYEGSMLRLQARTSIPAGELHEVTVYRINGIQAQCGMSENGVSSTISVVSASDPPWNATGEFTFTQAVGPGCRELGYCSFIGKCDYCLQRCECPERFGSLSELERNPVLSRNCSQMTCSYGVSWTPVLSGHPRPDPDASHTKAECSNMGKCLRALGMCICQAGFVGSACERYACPNECSGNGACRNMREMGLMRAAEPLVNATTAVSSRGDSAEGSDIAYGWGSPEGTGTWESRSVFGCVCDSSWENGHNSQKSPLLFSCRRCAMAEQVGLGPGQTQQAEYFGPDCSMRHCPTGDDPETEIDETDCGNKTADGWRGVGAAGNLCHVDCSNRGICDYQTGVCNCFDGYHGQACGEKQGDGYGFNTYEL